ncbi:HdeD family acid-resistance protein [Lutispora thermophila]|uniref:Uncharacterized membrane protein HdeD, DUF308 family n=1 Tax=Lutispora thermophila DSM 19022 TaxID=1122184 RepID=A0A1M6CY02_9FIRM|nr:DUF308 domain-containing protein [Lutispora thermophila]SHI65840.1 Uncharacterized membrane protein HdeD, DUF308 family [Lutispora thermophila DSM 19022]
MKARSITPMRIAKIGYIVMSVVLFSLGTLFIALPDISMRIIGKTLGATLIFFGCVKLVGYFSKDLFRLAFQYDLQFGILVFILGLVILLKPSEVINLLFAAMGIDLLADSLFKIQIALDSRKFGIGKWWGILALAILAGIISFALVFKPSESAKYLTVLLGATLIVEGALNLFVAITTVKIIKHQYPDFIEDDYFETEDENR